MRDPHVQALLLKQTSNTRAAAREKSKLSQLEIDAVTPLYEGCAPEDTRLIVTLKTLQMKTKNHWTDASYNENMAFWHNRLPKGNTCPTSIEEAKKIVCPLDLPHVKYHAFLNDCIIYWGETQRKRHVWCAMLLGTSQGRRLHETWYGTFRSLLVCSGIS